MKKLIALVKLNDNIKTHAKVDAFLFICNFLVYLYVFVLCIRLRIIFFNNSLSCFALNELFLIFVS